MRYKAHRPHYTLSTGETSRTSMENLWQLNKVMKCFSPPHRRASLSEAHRHARLRFRIGRSLSMQTIPPASVSLYVRNVCSAQKELKLRTHRSRSTLHTKDFALFAISVLDSFCRCSTASLAIGRSVLGPARSPFFTLHRAFISNFADVRQETADERTLLSQFHRLLLVQGPPVHVTTACRGLRFQ